MEHFNSYDYTKLSISSYVALLASLKRRLTNIKSSRIPLDYRKKYAFDTIMKYVSEKTGEDLQMWKDKLDIAFGIVKPPVIKTVKPAVDLSAFKVGDIVFAYTQFKKQQEGSNYSIYVKCKITKINKCSLTLTKYDYTYDESEVYEALQNQSFCKVYYIWKDTLTNEKLNIRKTDNLIVKGQDLYDIFMDKCDYNFDFGR